MQPNKSQYYLNWGFLIMGCISTLIGSYWFFAWLGVTGLGLLIITTILLLLIIAVITARSLNSLNAKKYIVEQELKESHTKYYDLVKYAPTGIYEVDFRSKMFTNVNDAMCLLTGYSREELLSISPFEILDDDGKKAFQKRIEQWLSGERPDENVEYRVLSKDGRVIYALLNAKFNVDENGNPKGATVVAHDITERKKYEIEIQSLAKFPSENPNPIVRLDKEGHVLYSNEAARAIMHTWNSVVGSRVPAEINSIVRKALSEGSSKSFEVECNDQIYLFQAVPIAGKDYINLYGMNITTSRMYENALVRSEEKYRMIVELSQEGILIASPEGQFQFINKRFAEMLGYDTEEIVGRYSGDFFYDEEDEVDVRESRKSLKEGKTIQKDMKFRRKDGSMLFTLYNATPLFDSMGNHIGNLAMHTDITTRKQAEEALKKSEERLRIALDNGKIGIWEWDLVTGEVIWDERMEHMFGLEPGTFDWTHESFASYVHEEDLQYINAAIEKALKSENSYEAVYRTKPKGGKSNYISSKALITRNDKGNPVHVSGVCFDVTDMKEGTERSLIALNEALLRSNNDLQQFAYVASHDLQEPLRMVSSFTQLLQMQYGEKLDERAKEYINFAVEGSKRMYELLNGLLAYSRIQTKGVVFHEVSMDNVIEKVKDNLRLLISEKEAEITSEEMPMINADENQMVQLLQNLIENGVKFCDKKPILHISFEPKNDYYLFSIRDNGIGIDPQYYNRVFRIFQRLHAQDRYNGTGIGLAICKKIAERHGGEIWVESIPGMGSTFSFTVPRSG
jgi:PAS domain S-box-containing protein